MCKNFAMWIVIVALEEMSGFALAEPNMLDD